MSITDFGTARGENLIPSIRHEITRPLAQALLAKFPKAVIHLWDYNWTCAFSMAKEVDGVQYRQGWYLCGTHPSDGEPFSHGMPDYGYFVEEINRFVNS